MKKHLFLAIAMISFAVSSVFGQTVENSRFFDNWLVGVKGGIVTPLKGEGTPRGMAGLNLEKKITPVWGLGIEGEWTVNTSGWDRFPKSTTVFDHQLLGVYTTVNLMNLFGGYKGTPRVFEVDLNVGAGWLHTYMNNHNELYKLYGASAFNSWYTKVGPDFNFNLGNAKAWTLSLKPAFVYGMKYPGSTGYNVHHGYFELQAGVSYHFKNKNGTHSFVLHSDDDLLYEIAMMQDEINRLQNLPVEVQYVEKVVEVTNEVKVPEIYISSVVGFKLNSAKIEDPQFANIQNVAKILKDDPNLKLNLLGYASAAEGSHEVNAKLSIERAKAVKDVLVRVFNIEYERLNVIGKGDTSQPWNENSWNRCVEFQVAD